MPEICPGAPRRASRRSALDLAVLDGRRKDGKAESLNGGKVEREKVERWLAFDLSTFPSFRPSVFSPRPGIA
jgi:hypothetical protein